VRVKGSLRETEQAGETLAVAATPQATIERVKSPGMEEVGVRKVKITNGLAILVYE